MCQDPGLGAVHTERAVSVRTVTRHVADVPAKYSRLVHASGVVGQQHELQIADSSFHQVSSL